MSNLAKYHSRAPRYVLDSDDETLIRLAGPHRTPWEEGTAIQNVSLTGLAFTAPEDLSPQLGEVIKIQFTVPGGQQMACYGLVTRLDDISKERNQKLVGVQFYKLDLPQRVALAQGLIKKLKPGSEDLGLLPQATPLELPMTVMPTLIFMASLLSLWCWMVVALIHLNYVGVAELFTPFLKTFF